MDTITISNGTTTITMPRTRNVTDAGALETKDTKMAGGRITSKIIGFRPGFTYVWDYVPAATVIALAQMLRTGRFFTVGYFDLDGVDKSGSFSVSYPAPQVFKFVDGVAMWHGFTLTIMAQEVS